jgi:hypothetical protein
MKNIKSVVCIIVILSTLTVKSFGSSSIDDSVKIIKSYIDSYTNNNAKLMKKILADGATLKLSRGEALLVQSKENIVDFMRASGKMTQECDTKYEVLSNGTALVVARVDFEYQNAVQHIYLIIEKNPEREWKITQICKIINDKEYSPDTNVLTKN